MDNKDLLDGSSTAPRSATTATTATPKPVATAGGGQGDTTPEAFASKQRSTYVRQRAPRRAQEAIDDFAEDEGHIKYSHESNIATGGLLMDRSYRKAQTEISQFQKNNRYGQYLEIPKGRRSIFARRERMRRRQSALAAILVVGILALVAYLIWHLMSAGA